jgi:hypothetical protein
MLHMRTLAQLADHYRRQDPETAVTPYFLRHKALSGEIPSVMAGSKRLVAIEAVDEYLAKAQQQSRPQSETSGIRRIDG